MNKLGILFFHPSKLMRSLSMLQCCLYCWSNVSTNRMQNLKTRFQKLCWGAAWLRQRQCQCKPNAEPENSFSKVMLRCSLTSPKAMSVQTECKTWKHVSKVMLRCSLTSRQQRYNIHNPKSKFFVHLISHLESFPNRRMSIQPFVYRHSGAFFTRKKK